MHRGYWSTENSSCLQSTCSFTCNFKSHECYRDQWGGMNSLLGDCQYTQCPTGAPPNYHPHLPVKPRGVFGEVQKGHGCPLYFHLRLDPQDTISWLQFGHQSRHAAVCCIQRSWEMWHRCLPASSHGMQARRPEVRGKRQSLVFVSLNHKLLKTLRKHVELVQLRK